MAILEIFVPAPLGGPVYVAYDGYESSDPVKCLSNLEATTVLATKMFVECSETSVREIPLSGAVDVCSVPSETVLATLDGLLLQAEWYPTRGCGAWLVFCE